MPHVNHQYQEEVVSNLVDHAIGPDADPPSAPTGQLFRAWGPGRFAELSDGLDEAGTLTPAELRQGLLCRSFGEELVAHSPELDSISRTASSKGIGSDGRDFAWS
jgi:hypothetical protein